MAMSGVCARVDRSERRRKTAFFGVDPAGGSETLKERPMELVTKEQMAALQANGRRMMEKDDLL